MGGAHPLAPEYAHLYIYIYRYIYIYIVIYIIYMVTKVGNELHLFMIDINTDITGFTTDQH